MCEILKASALQWENSFSWECFSNCYELQLAIGSYAVLWNFQPIKLISQRSVSTIQPRPQRIFSRGLGTRLSTICKIMNIYVDFRIFVSASQSVQYFRKNTKTQIKLKPKAFCKIEHMLLSRMLWFSWKFFLRLKTTWILYRRIRFVLNYPEFESDLKTKKIEDSVIFAK